MVTNTYFDFSRRLKNRMESLARLKNLLANLSVHQSVTKRFLLMAGLICVAFTLMSKANGQDATNNTLVVQPSTAAYGTSIQLTISVKDVPNPSNAPTGMALLSILPGIFAGVNVPLSPAGTYQTSLSNMSSEHIPSLPPIWATALTPLRRQRVSSPWCTRQVS